MRRTARHAMRLLGGVAGCAILVLAWQAHDRAALVLLLASFPFCG